MTKNKRNGRKQDIHLKLARNQLNLLRELGEVETGGGRPSAQQTVMDYLKDHPNATKTDIKNDTGLSYPTIRKYYSAFGGSE